MKRFSSFTLKRAFLDIRRLDNVFLLGLIAYRFLISRQVV